MIIMKFDRDKYLVEMKSLISMAIDKISKEGKLSHIYTVSIWTDPSAAASSINFDTKENSDKKIESANKFNKKYYDEYMAKGDVEQAKLFEPIKGRNCNPADFALRDFIEIENKAIPNNWEEISEGKCWEELELALKEVGSIAFNEISKLNERSDFEIGVNGRNDWYEFTWNKNL